MERLSSIERLALIDVVSESHGWNLSWANFAEQVLGLFEDISGMERIPPPEAVRLSYQLWKIYCEQKDQQSRN